MVTKLAIFLIIFHLHQAYNTPLRQFRESKPAHGVPLLIPHQPTQSVPINHVTLMSQRVKKSHNIISLPPIVVENLHVIPLPQSKVHHNVIRTDVQHIVTNDNVNIPLISHTVSHSSHNITNATPTILYQYTHNLVPLHDLSVIPLQKTLHTVHKVDPSSGHYRLMETREDQGNEEPVNILRSIYGGFGTGLYFGGQGAGHGFHIFG